MVLVDLSAPIQAAHVALLEPWQCVRLWLMAGWLYERRDVELIDDDTWHALCERIRLDRVKMVEANGAEKYIPFDDLETGSAMALNSNLPRLRSIYGALHLYEKWYGKKLPGLSETEFSEACRN